MTARLNRSATLARLAGLAGALWRSRKANIALTAAICAPLLLMVAGFAVDYARTSYVNQGLSKAADAAALAAVSQSAATSGGGYGNIIWLQQYGLNIFKGNMARLNISATPSLTVVPNGTGGVIATASYNYAVPTFFTGVIGMSSMPVKGTVTATANPQTYINYYIIVDVSQSMGIGATNTDMINLFDRVISTGNQAGGETGCVFGCHVPEAANAGGLQHYSNENLAHSASFGPPITLRIDAAVTAIQGIIADAQASAGTGQNVKIGLYTTNDYLPNGLFINQISAPTANYTQLKTLAATIDLGNNSSAGIGDSDFTSEMTYASALLPLNGTGASAISPVNYVFIITDGLNDSYGPACLYQHCIAAFDPLLCVPLKLKATVGTIYTTYLPILQNPHNPTGPLENNYNALHVGNYVPQIKGNLQACASAPNLAYEAVDGPALNVAMKALFASTLKTARLTH